MRKATGYKKQDTGCWIPDAGSKKQLLNIAHWMPGSFDILLDPGYRLLKKLLPASRIKDRVSAFLLLPVSRDQYQVSIHFLKPGFSHLLLTFFILLTVNSSALEMDLEGQFSGWTIESDINDHWENSTGIRYIPDLDISHNIDNYTAIDSEISLNMFSSGGSGPYRDETDIDLYRADLRYTTTLTETRIGLQKINFGPALLLRPLKWFDKLDPTDPLQMTDGVYAARFRYVAPDNSNYWAWLLYGNDKLKGYEIMPSTEENMEAGGRIQYPILSGDMGFTFHTRKVDASGYHIPNFRENRYALDGRWDMGIGLWFESLLEEQDTLYIKENITKKVSIGADYTFNVGAGLYMLVEHMGACTSDKIAEWDNTYHISAFRLSFPAGIMDTLSATGYYDWENDKYYQHINWARTYDSIMINVSLFDYPETDTGSSSVYQGAITGGRGIQVMVIYNH